MRDRPTTSDRPIDEISLLGGHPVLDLVNTLGWRSGDQPKEWLPSHLQAVRWYTHAGIISREEGALLHRTAGPHPALATEAHRRLLDLRETLALVLAPIAAGRPAVPDRLDALHRIWADAALAAQLRPHDGGAVLRWPIEPDETPEDLLAAPRRRLAESAIRLLADPELARLRECDGEECGWLFLDRSRNQTRRWCSSADCGNRARVRQHLARRRLARPSK